MGRIILTPKNWQSFQHYKDRSPSWIKLHKGLLDDFEFCCLPVASKALAPFLWLLASEYEDGKIIASLDELAFRLRMTRGELAGALTPLVESGFFDASEPLAKCEQDASPEKESKKEDIEKRESEKRARDDGWPDDYREVFWSLFPNKVGKPKALAKLDLCRRRGIAWTEIIGGLRDYIRDKPPDRQWLNPETFLNQERWADRPAIVHGKQQNGSSREIPAACDNLLERLNAGFGGAAPQEHPGGGTNEIDARLLAYGRG